jgi:predicted transposase/invertase (TIGR01784 family)
LSAGQGHYHNTFHIRGYDTHQVLNDDREIHFLELPKLLCRTAAPQTRLEKWLLYLSNAEGEEMEEVAMSEPMIRKALTCEQIFTKSAQERRRYELRESYNPGNEIWHTSHYSIPVLGYHD